MFRECINQCEHVCTAPALNYLHKARRSLPLLHISQMASENKTSSTSPNKAGKVSPFPTSPNKTPVMTLLPAVDEHKETQQSGKTTGITSLCSLKSRQK